MNKVLRIAIAGAGQMGLAHAEAYRANGAEIVAVVDQDANRAAQLAQSYGGRAFTDLDAIWAERPDALSICLPHSLHFDVAMKSVAHRVPILIEKPHCISMAESQALRAACARSGVLAMAGFTHRFLATSQHLKNTIVSGRFGRIDLVVDRLIAGSLGSSHPYWYRQRALAGGGIAMIGMIHAVDRLRWLLGTEIAAVTALTRASDPGCDVENTALAMLEFASGAQAMLVAHRSPVQDHERAHHYEIYGERLNASCAVGSFDHQELHYVGAGDLDPRTVRNDQPFVAEIREFISALDAGRTATPDLLDAEIALEVVLAIYDSAHSRRAVDLRTQRGGSSHSSPHSHA
jgi:predicted dehydrogenase